MTPQALFAALSPSTRGEILRYFQAEERPAYRAMVQALTGARKLRPQFILDKPRETQLEWVLSQLGLRVNHALLEQTLQIWLIKSQTPMLVTFLDALGIAHDGKGQVDELPEQIEAGKAKEAIAKLLGQYPSEHVLIYLHLFATQRPGGWPGLDEAIASTPELKTA
jgi:hypothetical protein